MAKGKSASKKKRKHSIETRNARKEREQKKKRDRYVKYGALALILFVAGFYLSARGEGASGSPAILIEPTFHDFGDVSVAGETVKTSMTIRNTGDGNLVISDMETSCDCTSATVEKDGVEGPIFTMKGHGPSPVGWSETLKPGETAFLNVYYDPKVHLDLRGPVTRGIAVYSNDRRAPAKEVRIHVNHVD